MNFNLKKWFVAVAIVAFVLAPISGVWAGRGKAKVIPPSTKAFGKTYAEWSAAWWQWHFSLPATDHPNMSDNGANCDLGQKGKVWFLAGTSVNELPDPENPLLYTVVRDDCSIPAGKAIFFPIVNAECSNVEGDGFQLIEDGPDMNVGTCAAQWVKGPSAVMEDLSVEVDGKIVRKIEDYRVLSQVFDLSFEDPSDNMLGLDCTIVDCENMRSVSDGYWVMLAPLRPGNHTIRFTGSFRDTDTGDLYFGLDVTYELSIGN